MTRRERQDSPKQEDEDFLRQDLLASLCLPITGLSTLLSHGLDHGQGEPKNFRLNPSVSQDC